MTTKTARKIVKIDEDKCNGCGACVPACVEGALRIIDGKARLVSETYCDGLGACLGECPQDAIIIEERPAEDFDLEAAEQHMKAKAGGELPHVCPSATVTQFDRKPRTTGDELPCGCSSATVAQFDRQADVTETAHAPQQSRLGHWPVQLTLVPPSAPFLKGANLLLAADCVPFAYAGFHQEFLEDHALLIACPKLDDFAAHLDKLTQVLRQAAPASITVVHMEVPCCSGLTHMARQAIAASGRDIPFLEITIGVRGERK